MTPAMGKAPRVGAEAPKTTIIDTYGLFLGEPANPAIGARNDRFGGGCRTAAILQKTSNAAIRTTI